MKILNLFAGIGGNRTLWDGYKHEITAIEENHSIADIYQKRFPNDNVFETDAYDYLEKYYEGFDFIWASPPCRTHTRAVSFPLCKPKLPDLRLYSIIIFLQRFFSGKWVVENVISHYTPLVKPTIILDRHYFWSNISLRKKTFKKMPGKFFALSWNQLCKYLNVDPKLIREFAPEKWENHDWKRQVLRNCVKPKIGKYILDSLKTITLEKFTNKQ